MDFIPEFMEKRNGMSSPQSFMERRKKKQVDTKCLKYIALHYKTNY